MAGLFSNDHCPRDFPKRRDGFFQDEANEQAHFTVSVIT
jgi:hypothetical protein